MIHKRQWLSLILIAALVLAGGLLPARGALPVRAQDDAAERIRAAYEAYEEWDTYQFQLQSTALYAVVVDGKEQYFWQTLERSISMIGWYDQSNPTNLMASMTITANSSDSTDTGGGRVPATWDLDMDVAVLNGEPFWRGTYAADPVDDFSLPQEWSSFSSSDFSGVPALVDLSLDRYLHQTDLDPFIDDFEAWLNAAASIDGPQRTNLDRQTVGDMYTVTVNIADVPGALEDRFSNLTQGDQAVVSQDALLSSVRSASTLTWVVVLDPDSGRLMAQSVSFDISGQPEAAALAQPYTTLSLRVNDERRVVFSNVNEPVDTSALPQQ